MDMNVKVVEKKSEPYYREEYELYEMLVLVEDNNGEQREINIYDQEVEHLEELQIGEIIEIYM